VILLLVRFSVRGIFLAISFLNEPAWVLRRGCVAKTSPTCVACARAPRRELNRPLPPFGEVVFYHEGHKFPPNNGVVTLPSGGAERVSSAPSLAFRRFFYASPELLSKPYGMDVKLFEIAFDEFLGRIYRDGDQFQKQPHKSRTKPNAVVVANVRWVAQLSLLRGTLFIGPALASALRTAYLVG
jgi:hypothetical protein